MTSRARGRRKHTGATREPQSSAQPLQDGVIHQPENSTQAPLTFENNAPSATNGEDTNTIGDSPPNTDSTPPTATDLRDVSKLQLTPDMFINNSIVRSAVKCYRCHYTEPYTCWSDTPKHMRELWFSNFKHRYSWKAEHEAEIKDKFYATVQRRMKDNISKASKKREPDVWMSGDLHKRLKEVRNDPEFKKRSERARKNRLSNSVDDDGKFDPGHHQGSISTPALANRMAKLNSGKRPLASEVWEEGHSVKDKDGHRQIVGKKSVAVKAKLDLMQEEASQTGIEKSQDEMFFDAVGGWKGGVVPGLGSGSSLFYKKPVSRSRQSATTYCPSEIAILSERMAENERIVKEQRAQLEEQRKMNEAMARQIELMSQAFRDNCPSMFTPSQPRDHPEPDDNAGSAAAV